MRNKVYFSLIILFYNKFLLKQINRLLFCEQPGWLKSLVCSLTRGKYCFSLKLQQSDCSEGLRSVFFVFHSCSNRSGGIWDEICDIHRCSQHTFYHCHDLYWTLYQLVPSSSWNLLNLVKELNPYINLSLVIFNLKHK